MRKNLSYILALFLTFSVLWAGNDKLGIYEIQDGQSTALVTGQQDKRNITFLNPVTGSNGTYSVGTFKGTLDGNPVLFYCIDLGHNIKYNEPYTDDGNTPAQITYILNNYYPYKAMGYPGSLGNVNDEAAAVQGAIWHYSDSLDVTTMNNAAIKIRALEIIADANANAGTTSPVNTLDISPLVQTLVYGTTAKFVVEAYDENNDPAEGIVIDLATNSDGVLSHNQVTTNALGLSDSVSLTHVNDDAAVVTASASVIIPQGTRFVHAGAPDNYQQLVLATPQFGSREVQADISWYPEVDLRVTKSADTVNPEDSTNVTFTLTVSNDTQIEATGVVVRDLLPDGMEFVSANPAGDYDENTGIWTVGTVPAGGSKSLELVAMMDYGAANLAHYDLGPATDYNLFVIKDLTQPSSDTEGRVAVGRNAHLQNYSVGDKLPNSGGTDDVLVVGRKLTFLTGDVYAGNVVYGRFKNVPENVVSIRDGTIRKDTVVDFAAAEAYLKDLSSTLSGYSVNGTTTFEWGGLTLSGSDPFLNVFEVAGADLNTSNSMTINVPNGSVVLVNINGKNLVWGGGLQVNGTDISNVLFNFWKAKTIEIQYIDVTGTILAPKAKVNFISGVQNGQMIAKFVEGQGQFNNVKFLGNIPIDPYIPNTVEIVSADQVDPDLDNNSDQSIINILVQHNPNNGGQPNLNWQQAPGVGSNELVWTMTEDLNGDLIAGTWGGKIYRLENNGANWIHLNTSGMTVGYVWSLAVNDAGNIFAGTEQGLFKSDVNGENWAATTFTGKDVRAVVIDPQDDDIMYIGTWGFGVYKSIDGGATWNEMNTGLVFTAIHALAMTSTSELYAGTFGGGVQKYDAQGGSWLSINGGFDHIWSLAVNSQDEIYAGTYGGGVLFSTDGAIWTTENAGLGSNYIYYIRIDAQDNVFVSTWMNGVYMLANAPAPALGKINGSWLNLGLSGFEVSAVYKDEATNTLYAGAGDGTIYMADINNVTGLGETETIGELDYTLEQNYPNPFNPSTTISFSVKTAGVYKIKIYNVIGQEVAQILNENLNPGQYNVSFDARKLGSGVYIYTLKGNDVQISKKMMLLK